MSVAANLQAFDLRTPEDWTSSKYRGLFTVADKTTEDKKVCVLDIPIRQPILGTEIEQQNWERLELHRNCAFSWLKFNRYRFVPIWLMVSNAIIFHLGKTRIPYIGGPHTAWHWGAAAGLAQHPHMLLLAFWRTPYRQMWKAGLGYAAGLAGTGAIYLYTTCQVGGHSEHVLDYWKRIGEDLAQHFPHVASELSDRRMHCDETQLGQLNDQAKSISKNYRDICGAEPPKKFRDELDAIANVVNFLGHDKVAAWRERFKGVARTLTQSSDRPNGKHPQCATRKYVEKRDKLIAALDQHNRSLTAITQKYAELTEAMKKVFRAKGVELKPFHGQPTDDARLRVASEADTAYHYASHVFGQLNAMLPDESDKFLVRYSELAAELGEPIQIYQMIVAVEWPGELELDYELVYLLAHCHVDKWHDAQNWIEGLQNNTIPPAAFFNWGVSQAIQQTKKDIGSDAAARSANRRAFVRRWLADPIRLALDTLRDSVE